MKWEWICPEGKKQKGGFSWFTTATPLWPWHWEVLSFISHPPPHSVGMFWQAWICCDPSHTSKQVNGVVVMFLPPIWFQDPWFQKKKRHGISEDRTVVRHIFVHMIFVASLFEANYFMFKSYYIGWIYIKRKPYEFRIQWVYFNSLILHFYHCKNCN